MPSLRTQKQTHAQSECPAPEAPLRECPYRIALLALLGAAEAMLCIWRWSASATAAFACAFFVLLTACALIDHNTRRIPNALAACIGVLGASAALASVAGLDIAFPIPAITWQERVIGLFVTGVPLLVFAVITNGFGGGDVKLLAAVGLVLGWRLAIATLAGSILLGGCQALFLVVARGARRSDTFAFGPSIGIATIAVCLLATL